MKTLQDQHVDYLIILVVSFFVLIASFWIHLNFWIMFCILAIAICSAGYAVYKISVICKTINTFSHVLQLKLWKRPSEYKAWKERKIPKVNLKITELSEQLISLNPQDLQYQKILQNLKDVKIASKITGLL